MIFEGQQEFPHMLMVTVAQYSMVTVVVGISIALGILRNDGYRQLPKSQRVGRVLSLFAGFFFVTSGCGIMYGVPLMVANFTSWNLYWIFKFIGVCEITFGTLILFPKTYKLGFLLAVALTGGAIATHLPTHTDGIFGALPATTTMTVLMLSAFFYTPEMFPEWLTNFVLRKN